MMPMKKLLLLSLVLLCSLTAWTAQRSPEEALSIARTFFIQSSEAVTRNTGDIQLVAVSNDLLKSVSTRSVNCTPKVGQVKHYPVIERVRYCTGLFPFNRALILLLL